MGLFSKLRFRTKDGEQESEPAKRPEQTATESTSSAESLGGAEGDRSSDEDLGQRAVARARELLAENPNLTHEDLLAILSRELLVGRVRFTLLSGDPSAVTFDAQGNVRRDYYVYVHKDSGGRAFYVGKGTGRRAYSTERRNPFWKQYVESRLNGQFDVEIVRSGLTEGEAYRVEAETRDSLVREGAELLGYDSPSRKIDIAKVSEYHRLRNRTMQDVKDTRALEKSRPEEAVHRYLDALERMYEYSAMECETGLVADLARERRAADIVILDRLTLCLGKLGRHQEAGAASERFFEQFPHYSDSTVGRAILKRVARASR